MDHRPQHLVEVSLGELTADPALQPRIGGLDLDHVKALEAVSDAISAGLHAIYKNWPTPWKTKTSSRASRPSMSRRMHVVRYLARSQPANWPTGLAGPPRIF